MELNIDDLRKICDNKHIVYSVHALERLQERGIFRKDVVNTLATGEIIEQYPDDYPYPSCLVFGMTTKNERLHVVCACNGDTLKIITAYCPTLDKFQSDYKTRKETGK